MKRVAVLYDTVSGSTADMAAIIGEELGRQAAVDLLPVAAASSLAAYDAVVLGSPMRFGWCTGRMRRFLKGHRHELAGKPVAMYFSVLYVVRLAEEPVDTSRLFLDPGLAVATIPRKKASGMDKTHSLGYYEGRRRTCGAGIAPVSVAFFKGRLVIDRLPLLARLFMKVVVRLTTKEQEGEFLDPAAVRAWAGQLADRL